MFKFIDKIVDKVVDKVINSRLEKDFKDFTNAFGGLYQREVSKIRPIIRTDAFPAFFEKLQKLTELKEKAYAKMEELDEKAKAEVKLALSKIEELEQHLKEKHQEVTVAKIEELQKYLEAMKQRILAKENEQNKGDTL